jgi:hypothetical protein
VNVSLLFTLEGIFWFHKMPLQKGKLLAQISIELPHVLQAAIYRRRAS